MLVTERSTMAHSENKKHFLRTRTSWSAQSSVSACTGRLLEVKHKLPDIADMNCSPEAIFAVAGNKLLMTLALCLLVTFQETKKTVLNIR